MIYAPILGPLKKKSVRLRKMTYHAMAQDYAIPTAHNAIWSTVVPLLFCKLLLLSSVGDI